MAARIRILAGSFARGRTCDGFVCDRWLKMAHVLLDLVCVCGAGPVGGSRAEKRRARVRAVIRCLISSSSCLAKAGIWCVGNFSEARRQAIAGSSLIFPHHIAAELANCDEADRLCRPDSCCNAVGRGKRREGRSLHVQCPLALAHAHALSSPVLLTSRVLCKLSRAQASQGEGSRSTHSRCTLCPVSRIVYGVSMYHVACIFPH